MKILHDSAAMLALNNLKENNTKRNKRLKNLTTGEKINMAQSSSGFAISEKMRANIRAMQQDIRNTQTGMNMLKVAEGAVSSTVDILRTLKEKAINSANDTNTDADRAQIQKQVNALVDQVDHNALVAYNGKTILDGSTVDSNPTVQQHIIKALYTEWIPNTLDLIKDSFGVSFEDNETEYKYLNVVFSDSANILGAGSDGSGVLGVLASDCYTGHTAHYMEMRINMDQFGTLDVKDTANVNGLNPAGTGVLDRTIAHELTHGIMAAAVRGYAALPDALMEGIAEVVHGVDDVRYLQGLNNARNVVANTNFTINSSASNTAADINAYVGGYMAMRYMEKQGGEGSLQQFMKHLVQQGGGGLDSAVAAATHGKFSGWGDMTTKMQADAAACATDDEFLMTFCNINLHNEDTGSASGYDAGNAKAERTGDTVVSEAGSTKFWYSPTGSSSVINGLTVYWPTDWASQAGKLNLQIGIKAGQSLRFGFLDMGAEAMGLKSAHGDIISLATQDDANLAIRVLDQAVERAMNVQTTIGALESRLEMTESNLTLAAENLVNSESAIRDADMAKEMTEYTKYNVLYQAAQAMLAQANQNKSQVLGLLQ
ncbi:MAG: flagellinolysin [Selenomonadaceae bacterium]|nr:flagellinolysin [Selenomonadaceae bacterium]